LQQDNTTLQGIGFNMKQLFPLVESGEWLDVVFTIDENEYNGNISLQLKVLDVKAHVA
jgi:single-stranded-DNA-specific exonuclease